MYSRPPLQPHLRVVTWTDGMTLSLADTVRRHQRAGRHCRRLAEDPDHGQGKDLSLFLSRSVSLSRSLSLPLSPSLSLSRSLCSALPLCWLLLVSRPHSRSRRPAPSLLPSLPHSLSLLLVSQSPVPAQLPLRPLAAGKYVGTVLYCTDIFNNKLLQKSIEDSVTDSITSIYRRVEQTL